MMHDLIIIGGGAAGMACAVTAAGRGLNVLVLERLDRVGKKLLATGNGRCNLMNSSGLRYPGGEAFARQVLARIDADAQKAFWARYGLHVREEDGGRLYPVSGQATSVLDALRLGMALHGVQIETGAHVTKIENKQHCFTVHTADKQYKAKNVLIAGGGQSQPKLGSDGSCMKLLRDLGHTIVPCKPVLTQIVTDTKPIAGLSGIRVKAEVSVQKDNLILHREQGELLFADYGVSGVCAMQCARYADQPGAKLTISFLKGMGFEDVASCVEELSLRAEAWRMMPMEQLLTGLCVPRLASALCKAAGVVWKDRLIGSLSVKEIRMLARVMDCFVLRVTGIKGFEQSQVTGGGAATEEFDPSTMQSRIVPGLYAAGEVLDVDGDCGGYNLMFAFAGGIIAGKSVEV